MIRYRLRCAQGHTFDHWFKSGSTYAQELIDDNVTCPDCGDTDLQKAIMAPSVAASTAPAGPPPPCGNATPCAGGCPAMQDW